MNRKFIIANSILWATAIIAAALLGAPTTLSIILLPSLAGCSLLAALPRAAGRDGSAESLTEYDTRC
jgi:hypothetical protein